MTPSERAKMEGPDWVEGRAATSSWGDAERLQGGLHQTDPWPAAGCASFQVVAPDGPTSVGTGSPHLGPQAKRTGPATGHPALASLTASIRASGLHARRLTIRRARSTARPIPRTTSPMLNAEARGTPDGR